MRSERYTRFIVLGIIMMLMSTITAHALQWAKPNIPTGDTKLLYHFDGTGTTVVDSGPNGINATLSNSAARAGASPTWLYSPSGDYIVQSTSTSYQLTNAPTVTGIDFNKGLTISGWIRNRTGETQGGVLFYVEAVGQLPRVFVANGNYTLAGYESRIYLNVAGASNSTLVPLDNGWHHIAFTYDPVDGLSSNGGVWRFYVDNSLISTITSVKNLSATTQFSMGVGRSPFGDRLAGAEFDEVLVENATITSFAIGIPTISEWGLIALAGMILITGARKLLSHPLPDQITA